MKGLLVLQTGKSLMVGGVGIVVAIALVGYFMSRQQTTVPQTALLSPGGSTTALVQPDPDPAPKTAPEEQVVPASPDTPRFDEVRRDPDGMTVIAGRAAPGSEVHVMSNGTEIATALADGAGKFATLAILPPDGMGQILSLEGMSGKNPVRSVEEVILAPMGAVSVAPAQASAADAISDTAQTVAQASAPEVQSAAAEDMATGSDPMPAGTDATTPQTPEPADDTVALLKSTPDGVELLSGSAPKPTKAIALDTITYSQQGEVSLAGRAQTQGRSVQVYLDNAAVGTLPVDAEGRWRGDIEDVTAGIYTLRVDELNHVGDVISRVETPFKRESPEVLARATANYDGPIKAITVQEGATLWAIARDRYGDPTLYVRVFDANRDSIRDPDLIYPGQVFTLPE
ncbi:LysM peptidoglycan-binding domain-containing protein [Roseobacter sp. GAI101]|uniref:LysM peptidoglycan-binding domain-containing protein n=1 Tax=Roseobacter sp. (strain GAI101) TaxID=391589 RepID=UPI000187254C|nr:LysM peptidoglycan-binding domain-containing protein [Roseobacter sp. GAI101]EEB83377.1 peptidoglycan-binding LysM [Roseobacter sp. GAI101]